MERKGGRDRKGETETSCWKERKKTISSTSEETDKERERMIDTVQQVQKERERESCRFFTANTEISCTWTAVHETHTQNVSKLRGGNRGRDQCSTSVCACVMCVFAHSQRRKSVFSECSTVRPKFNWILWK